MNGRGMDCSHSVLFEKRGELSQKYGGRKMKVIFSKALHVAPVRRVYDELWAEAQAAFRRGAPQLDAHLRTPREDPRRGLSLIVRPPESVRVCVQEFVGDAAAAAPGQYVSGPAETHMTVLSLLTGSPDWRSHVRQWPAFRRALAEILRDKPAFKITYRGVSASPQTVLIQGFPCDDSLQRLRDELRARLKERGLGGQLDKRFHTVAAHLTVMRFITPLPDWRPLVRCLESNRDTDFGEMNVSALQLIHSDWYMSRARTRVLGEYCLSH